MYTYYTNKYTPLCTLSYIMVGKNQGTGIEMFRYRYTVAVVSALSE